MESEGEFVYFVNNRRTHGGQIITPQRALDNTRPEGCTAPPGVTKAEAFYATQRNLYIVAHDPYFETGIPDRALGWWTCTCPQFNHSLVCEHVFAVQGKCGQLDLAKLTQDLRGRKKGPGRPQKAKKAWGRNLSGEDEPGCSGTGEAKRQRYSRVPKEAKADAKSKAPAEETESEPEEENTAPEWVDARVDEWADVMTAVKAHLGA